MKNYFLSLISGVLYISFGFLIAVCVVFIARNNREQAASRVHDSRIGMPDPSALNKENKLPSQVSVRILHDDNVTDLSGLLSLVDSESLRVAFPDMLFFHMQHTVLDPLIVIGIKQGEQPLTVDNFADAVSLMTAYGLRFEDQDGPRHSVKLFSDLFALKLVHMNVSYDGTMRDVRATYETNLGRIIHGRYWINSDGVLKNK